MGFEILKYGISVLLFVVCVVLKQSSSKLKLVLLAAFSFLMLYDVIKYGFVWSDLFLWVFLLVMYFYVFTPQNKSLLVVLLSIFEVVSLCFGYLFPMTYQDHFSGMFQVGTSTYTIHDTNRVEKYGHLDTTRYLHLQAWYPIDQSDGLKKARWLKDGIDVARALSIDSDLPSFLFDYMTKISSNSYLDGQLSSSSQTYPVVVLSHGWRSERNLYQNLAEELASHGYIVFGIDHTYGCVATKFDDLGLRKIDYQALPDRNDSTFLSKANQLVTTYGDDVGSTIAYLKQANQEDPRFRHRLDLSKIGLLGHSTGGGGDISYALEHQDITSVIGLDPWVEPIQKEKIEKGLQVPSLLLRSQQWENGENNDHLFLLNEFSKIKPIYKQVQNSTHYDFAMMSLYPRVIKALGYSGAISNDKMSELLKTTILSFFDQTLKKDSINTIQIPQNSYLKDIQVNKKNERN